MAIALVANTKISGASGGTTPGINTTGATLIVVHCSEFYAGSVGAAPTDSKGNTYLPLTLRTASNQSWSRIWYCENPVVGAAHTFSVAGSVILAAMQVAAFSGTLTASSFDVENGGTVGFGNTSMSPGAITGTRAPELIVTGLSANQVCSAPTIGGGFTITDSQDGSSNQCGAMAYLVIGSPQATNPAWGWTTAGDAAATIASFKAPAVTFKTNTGPMMGA